MNGFTNAVMAWMPRNGLPRESYADIPVGITVISSTHFGNFDGEWVFSVGIYTMVNRGLMVNRAENMTAFILLWLLIYLLCMNFCARYDDKSEFILG